MSKEKMTEAARRTITKELARRPTWSNVPPALTGRQVEGASLLPLGRYQMPDGSDQVSFGLPQPALDAYRSMRYGLGYEQDPNAPKGYVSHDAMLRGSQGAAEFAATGGIAAGAAMVPKGAIGMFAGPRAKSSLKFDHSRKSHGAPLDGNDVVVQLPVDQLDNVWKADGGDGYYLPKGQDLESGKFARIGNAGEALPVPEVGYAPDPSGNMQFGFTDGRHRFAYARDSGADTVPVATDHASAQSLFNQFDAPNLDMSEAARLQRAKDLGFDTDTVYYHGTKHPGFDQFQHGPDLSNQYGSKEHWRSVGTYLTPDEQYARMHGPNVGAYYVRKGDPVQVDGSTAKADRQAALQQAADEGRNYINNDPYAPEILVTDPRNIRSVDAAFDPRKINSPNLMYSAGVPIPVPGIYVDDDRR